MIELTDFDRFKAVLSQLLPRTLDEKFIRYAEVKNHHGRTLFFWISSADVCHGSSCLTVIVRLTDSFPIYAILFSENRLRISSASSYSAHNERLFTYFLRTGEITYVIVDTGNALLVSADSAKK
ncbi:MAG: hypothetical protein IT536_19725 [Hyphomicrobiales bacterium]|nr:hypothetical protein [Hyphomicrobiales bacterium]